MDAGAGLAGAGMQTPEISTLDDAACGFSSVTRRLRTFTVTGSNGVRFEGWVGKREVTPHWIRCTVWLIRLRGQAANGGRIRCLKKLPQVDRQRTSAEATAMMTKMTIQTELGTLLGSWLT